MPVLVSELLNLRILEIHVLEVPRIRFDLFVLGLAGSDFCKHLLSWVLDGLRSGSSCTVLQSIES